jgi:hypothetical protein
MATTYRIGPAVLLVADNFSDPVGDWTEFARTRGDTVVDVQPNVVAGIRTDQDGPAPIAGHHVVAGRPQSVRLSMADHDIAKAAVLYPGSLRVSSGTKEALTLGPGLASLTGKAMALVPMVNYSDDLIFLDLNNAVWFEKAYISVGEHAMGEPSEDDALQRYDVEIMRLSGQSGIGAAFLASGLTTPPQGMAFSWDRAIDGSIASALVGTGEIVAVQAFPADGLTILLKLNATTAGDAKLGDATLVAGKFSAGIQDTGCWVRAGGILYTIASTGGANETVMTVTATGVVNVWDDNVQTATNTATAGMTGFALNSAGDDVASTYTEADVDALLIVRGIWTPAQMRRLLRTA